MLKSAEIRDYWVKWLSKMTDLPANIRQRLEDFFVEDEVRNIDDLIINFRHSPNYLDAVSQKGATRLKVRSYPTDVSELLTHT
jgi:hypothetical protein